MKLPVTRTSFGPRLRRGPKLSRYLRGPAGLNFPGLHRKRMAEREKRNEYVFLREHTNKSWRHKRTCASFCTAAQEHLSQWPFPLRKMEDSTARVCARKRKLLIPNNIPNNMLRECKIQIARWHQGCTPIPHISAWISLKIWEGKGKQNDNLLTWSHQFVVAFQSIHVSNVPPHFPYPKPQVSSEILVTNREPLHKVLDDNKVLWNIAALNQQNCRVRAHTHVIQPSKAQSTSHLGCPLRNHMDCLWDRPKYITFAQEPWAPTNMTAIHQQELHTH